jgi:hypothetical protein
MARQDASAVQANSKVYLFGGRSITASNGADDCVHSTDLWQLDLETCEWVLLHRPKEPSGTFPSERTHPESRHSACMWCWGSSLFVFGGAARRGGIDCSFGDLWRFDLELLVWQAVPLRGTLLPLFIWCGNASNDERGSPSAELWRVFCVTWMWQSEAGENRAELLQATRLRPAAKLCLPSLTLATSSSVVATPLLPSARHRKPRTALFPWRWSPRAVVSCTSVRTCMMHSNLIASHYCGGSYGGQTAGRCCRQLGRQGRRVSWGGSCLCLGGIWA